MKKDFTIEEKVHEESFDIDAKISLKVGSMLERSYALGYLVGKKEGQESGYEKGLSMSYDKGWEDAVVRLLDNRGLLAGRCIGCSDDRVNGCNCCCRRCDEKDCEYYPCVE